MNACPNDEGEAVADAESSGFPVPIDGARDRCQRHGLLRLGVFFVLTCVGGVVLFTGPDRRTF